MTDHTPRTSVLSLAMTSRELADLTGKAHKNGLRDIENVVRVQW